MDRKVLGLYADPDAKSLRKRRWPRWSRGLLAASLILPLAAAMPDDPPYDDDTRPAVKTDGQQAAERAVKMMKEAMTGYIPVDGHAPPDSSSPDDVLDSFYRAFLGGDHKGALRTLYPGLREEAHYYLRDARISAELRQMHDRVKQSRDKGKTHTVYLDDGLAIMMVPAADEPLLFPFIKDDGWKLLVPYKKAERTFWRLFRERQRDILGSLAEVNGDDEVIPNGSHQDQYDLGNLSHAVLAFFEAVKNHDAELYNRLKIGSGSYPMPAIVVNDYRYEEITFQPREEYITRFMSHVYPERREVVRERLDRLDDCPVLMVELATNLHDTKTTEPNAFGGGASLVRTSPSSMYLEVARVSGKFKVLGAAEHYSR